MELGSTCVRHISLTSAAFVETDADNIAWAAVERFYVKEGGEWVARDVPG